jgi:hypothetical protein
MIGVGIIASDPARILCEDIGRTLVTPGSIPDTAIFEGDRNRSTSLSKAW